MNTVFDVIQAARRNLGVAADRLEPDPFVQTDALYEAQVLDVWCETLHSRAAILFELRTAAALPIGDTAILVAGGLRRFTWEAENRATGQTAWNVESSVPRQRSGLISLDLGMYPDADLSLWAETATFVLGNVPGLPEAPPDYGGEEEAIQAGIAHWHSPFEPLQQAVTTPGNN